MHKNDFMSTINKGYGFGGMFCKLTDVDLGNYLLEKVTTFMSSPSYRILTAVANVGQQNVNPSVYLLSQYISAVIVAMVNLPLPRG